MKWLAILFSLFIILIIVLADVGILSRILVFFNRVPFGDKVGHFILYGILTLLIDLALFRAYPARSRVRLTVSSGLVLALLIGLEEFSQKYFSRRSFDLVDLAFSYLGMVSFSWLAVRTKNHSPRN